MNTIVYRLYAMRLNEKNIERAIRERFQRITRNYILVYTTEILNDALEIKDENIESLSKQDMEWLGDCNIVAIKEFEQEHNDSVQKGQQNFLTAFEEELRKEKEKQDGRDAEE